MKEIEGNGPGRRERKRGEWAGLNEKEERGLKEKEWVEGEDERAGRLDWASLRAGS